MDFIDVAYLVQSNSPRLIHIPDNDDIVVVGGDDVDDDGTIHVICILHLNF